MRNIIHTAGLVTAGLLVALWPAAAEVITFDSYPVSDNDLQSGTITTQGFNFTADTFYIVNAPGDCAGGCVDDGSQFLASTGSTVTVTNPRNIGFSLAGLDSARLFLTPGGIASLPNADTLNLLGTLMNGSTVSTSLTLPLEGSFQTFAIGGFDDLKSLAISGTANGVGGASWALDNLVVAAVPEPAALMAMCGALGLVLALASRRRGS